MAADQDDVLRYSPNDDTEVVLYRWVMPYGGWWARWRADIDVEWPDGSFKRIWRRHFRSHTRAEKVSRKRFAAMDQSGSNEASR